MIAIRVHSEHEGHAVPQVLTMPGGWAELTGEQFLRVAGALYSIAAPIERHAAVCLALLGKNNVSLLPTETLIAEVFPLVEWIYEQPDVVRQNIPAVQVGLRKYYGPEGEFNNLRLVEFDFAERELFLYLNTKSQIVNPESQNSKEPTPNPSQEGNVERETPKSPGGGLAANDEALLHLWRFVACLYRPGKRFYNQKKDKDGDVRVKFNENMLNYHARQMRRYLPESFAYAVLLWYKACRNYLVKLYPVVFNSEGSAEPNPNELPNHFALIRKIAEKGTYGNYNDVEQMYLHTVLLEIEKTIIEQDEIKRQQRQS